MGEGKEMPSCFPMWGKLIKHMCCRAGARSYPLPGVIPAFIDLKHYFVAGG